MNRSELIRALSERSGVSQADARRVMDALSEVTREALLADEAVPLKGVGTLRSQWRPSKAIRSIRDRRKVMLDGRYGVRFQASGALKAALAARTPQRWRDPAHQRAWREAETLLGDLELYHADDAPNGLDPALSDDALGAACEDAFGPMWDRVVMSFEARVDAAVREERDYLLLAARRRWCAA